MSSNVAPEIEEGFRRLRAELAIRTAFPPEVLEEAERVARERAPRAAEGRADHTQVPFCTVDPPGSRDLDQAVHVERAGGGYRVRYAIADVGYWVDRGSAIEAEAWRRGVTAYAPDEREPLYPPVLSEDAASLLPDQPRPTVLFDLALDADGTLLRSSVAPALVKSRAQLTYAELLAGGTAPRAASASEPWAETLALLGELGPRLLALEAARGGVSLPVREQHVQRRAAGHLGYELAYEEPNEAEQWNAEISLLTGHVAAERMLKAGVGLLRTMPPFAPRDVARFRRIAQTLGFDWPDGQSYAQFMHGVDVRQAHVAALVRQARRVMHGADYVAFSGAPPEQPLHGALNFTYAHATAPLRRLADRYVLDLLVALDAGATVGDDVVATLQKLPAVMDAAERTAGRLERRVVDAAEAWALHEQVGQTLAAVVIDVERGDVEVQIEEPPVRATLALRGEAAPALGAKVGVRVESADGATGDVRLSLAGSMT